MPRRPKLLPIYVALLRGINVGGNKMISMPELKAAFEGLGFTDVKTYINSGNVIFRAGSLNQSALAARIEKAIQKEFGHRVTVLLRSFDEMERLTKALPKTWVNNEKIKCDIMFLSEEIDRSGIVAEMPHSPVPEDIKYFPGAVGWRIDRKNINKSRMLRLIGTPLYKKMTVRNPNTVRNLYELMKNYSHDTV